MKISAMWYCVLPISFFIAASSAAMSAAVGRRSGPSFLRSTSVQPIWVRNWLTSVESGMPAAASFFCSEPGGR